MSTHDLEGDAQRPDPFLSFTGDRAAAARLRANLTQIAREHPDTPIAAIAGRPRACWAFTDLRVPKMVRPRLPHRTRERRPSLRLADVLELAEILPRIRSCRCAGVSHGRRDTSDRPDLLLDQ